MSAAGGFDVVPLTVLRNGPLGPGSVQLWVGPVDGLAEPLVDVTPAAEVPEGWVVVLEGEPPGGRPVVARTAPSPALRTVAAFDAVLNNSDRKGEPPAARRRGGARARRTVSLSVEPELRTVLWGWAGEPAPEADLARLETLLDALGRGLADELATLLTRAEVRALRLRNRRSRCCARWHPAPRPGWPAIPWLARSRCTGGWPGEVAGRSVRPPAPGHGDRASSSFDTQSRSVRLVDAGPVAGLDAAASRPLCHRPGARGHVR